MIDPDIMLWKLKADAERERARKAEIERDMAINMMNVAMDRAEKAEAYGLAMEQRERDLEARAEAAESGLKALKADWIAREAELIDRVKTAEKRNIELTWQVNNMRTRADTAEKRIKELEPIVTMREQELTGELVRERGLVQLSHKRETAMRDLLMRFIPADRHEEVLAILEAKP